MKSACVVAVVSQVSAGHIPAYHAMLVRALIGAGCRVISVSPWAATEPEEAGVRHLNWPGEGQTSASPTGREHVRRSWMGRLWRQLGWSAQKVSQRRWQETTRILADAGSEPVWRPNLAILVFLGAEYLEGGVTGDKIDRWFPYPWGGIWNGPSWVSGVRGSSLVARLRPKHLALAARNCRFVWVPDRRLLPTQAERWPHVRFGAFPEIADLSPPVTESALEAILIAAGGRPMISLLGNVAERKGVSLFLETARLAEKAGHDWLFVLAGDFREGACAPDEFRRLQAAMAQPPGNCRFHLQRIADGASFNAWVVASRVLFAVYDRFPFNSNLLTKAAFFDRPVVVPRSLVMGSLVDEYGLGATVPARTAEHCLTAYRQLLPKPWTNPRRDEFLALNSPARLQSLVREILAGL